jgi:hypothetical protein
MLGTILSALFWVVVVGLIFVCKMVYYITMAIRRPAERKPHSIGNPRPTHSLPISDYSVDNPRPYRRETLPESPTPLRRESIPRREPVGRTYESEKCVICFENDAEVELKPCGHRQFCDQCLVSMVYVPLREGRNVRKIECPLCRCEVETFNMSPEVYARVPIISQ